MQFAVQTALQRVFEDKLTLERVVEAITHAPVTLFDAFGPASLFAQLLRRSGPAKKSNSRRGSGTKDCGRRAPSREPCKQKHEKLRRAVAARHPLAGVGHRIVGVQAFLMFQADVEVGDAKIGVECRLDAPRGILTEHQVAAVG